MATKIESFFKLDLKVKTTLMKSASSEYDFSTSRYTIKYLNNLYKSIGYLKFYLTEINKLTNLTSDTAIDNFFNKIYYTFLNLNDDEAKIKQFYETYFSNFNPDLVNKISTHFKGYLQAGNYVNDELLGCTSINELLHLFHSYILNDENILQEVPIIYKQDNIEGYPISLRGKNSKLGKNLVDALKSVSLGWTEICVFDKKIVMMVRDRGHALSIEIEKEDGLYYIKYHIPKLCNEEMIKNIKGVKEVYKEQNAALGEFTADEETILFEIVEFIKSVPTDSDIIYKDGMTFEEYIQKEREGEKQYV